MSQSPLFQNTQLRDFERIQAAIAFIHTHQREQPSLAAIAQHVHLSEHHFQKLFSRWAGISPKRFLQLLTVATVKRRLQESRSLLQLSLEAGLSSPSRLHDWFMRLEAMTPATYRAGGSGLQITYGIHPTLFGRTFVATTDRGVCNLQFMEAGDEAPMIAWLQTQWPQAAISRNQAGTQGISDRLNGILTNPLTNSIEKPLSLLVRGTNFQVQVWRALIDLPFGSLVTYQDIATHIGKPTAARAVGTAIGANPIAYLIPCHRVIRGTGELGGYRWGLPRKSLMLGWEASHTQNTKR